MHLNSFKLVLNRVLAEWKYQFGVWRTVIDWTVALYIVIPGGLLGLWEYWHWWTVPPAWLSPIPLSVWLTVCYIFAWSGSMRIFVEEADQLFLVQYRKWMSNIARLSLGYCVGRSAVSCLGLVLLLSPWLMLRYGLTLEQIFLLYLFILVLKTLLGIVKQLLVLRMSGWVRKIALFGLFAVGGNIFSWAIPFLLPRTALFTGIIVFCTAVTLALLRLRLRLRWTFFADLSAALADKYKWAGLLLRAAGAGSKNGRPSRRRPLLFRRSKLLFRVRTPANALTEICLKAVARNTEHLQYYAGLISLALLILVTLPVKWRIIIWLSLAVTVNFFVSLYWRETVNSPFVRMYKLTPEDNILASRKAIFWLGLPGLLLISSTVGFLTYAWLGIGLGLAAGVIIEVYASRLVALFV